MRSRYDPYLQWIDSQQPRMVELLRSWASINSGSYNITGLAAQVAALRPVLQELGGILEEVPLPAQAIITDTGQPAVRTLGNALSVRSPARKGPWVLLAIHFDTVFGAEQRFQSVTRVNEKTLRGPGVCDAKGGLIVMLFALLALERSPFASGLSWEILLNPDEEIGSPGSATLFEAAARRNDLALLFEPALPDGALVSSRKGSGNFTLIVHGRAAHAGRNAELGRNAIAALAHLVGNMAALEREIPGILVNTGFVHGGGPVNIVPDLALCRVNIRVESSVQQQAVEQRLAALIGHDALPEGIRVECHGGFHAPPKPLTSGVERTLQCLRACADQLQVPLTWRASGGACDGNRLGAAGLPTVDSLGVRGGNIHTDQEFVQLDSLAERARLTALFLMRMASGEVPLEALVETPRREVIQT